MPFQRMFAVKETVVQLGRRMFAEGGRHLNCTDWGDRSVFSNASVVPPVRNAFWIVAEIKSPASE